MRLVAATLYALRIPFVEAFAHSASRRTWCDSVVVGVRDETGTAGFGEGAPRTYVTGETPALMLRCLADLLWPAVAGRELPDLTDAGGLGALDALIPYASLPGLLAANASRAALELAVVDCLLRRRGASLGRVLPPCRRQVIYSGVITAGPLDRAAQQARQMKLAGLTQVKVKVGADGDIERVRAVREVLGPAASLRVDANGAWTLERAIAALRALAPLGVAVVEAPLPRGSLAELRRLREASPIPLMADESLVTLHDADALLAARAVDYVNVRVSKCGGLAPSLEIARRAARAGIRVQIGSQVGETAILAAAGRHLAAALEDVAFVEGSYGSLLLTEDVSAESVRFGHGGSAPILTDPGLGVAVREDRLRKYATEVADLPGARR